jgi:hypothetical protein
MHDRNRIRTLCCIQRWQNTVISWHATDSSFGLARRAERPPTLRAMKSPQVRSDFRLPVTSSSESVKLNDEGHARVLFSGHSRGARGLLWRAWLNIRPGFNQQTLEIFSLLDLQLFRFRAVLTPQMAYGGAFLVLEPKGHKPCLIAQHHSRK